MSSGAGTSVAFKLCGVRRAEDAAALAEFASGYRGRVLVGCVAAVDSPRRATARDIDGVLAAIDGGPVTPVLVFREEAPAEVVAIARRHRVDRVQCHGVTNSHLAELAAEGLRCHRVWSVAAGAATLPVLEPAPTEDLPSVLDVGRGGAGRPFDWNLLGGEGPFATFVAGGVGAHNLDDLLTQHRPWGVDLSSGVECAPGVKDRALLDRVFTSLETLS